MTRPSRALVVADASVLVAFLIDRGSRGEWASTQLANQELAAPDLALYEVLNVLRRQEISTDLESRDSIAAFERFLGLPIILYPGRSLARRMWQLRRNMTGYDAAYVALAERLGSPLVTLDARIAAAPDLLCDVVTYPKSG